MYPNLTYATPSQLGVTVATFSKCYTQLNGWHNWSKGFESGRDILLQKIQSLPDTERNEALSSAGSWQQKLTSKLFDNDEAFKFCEDIYRRYQLDSLN